MTVLKLYNSLTRQKEEFRPLRPGDIRVYACGPTVYDYAHIGNARMAVVFDQLVRVLRLLYPKVTYVSNITDIDDKIIAASAQTGETIDILTRKFESIYNADMAALGVALPDVQPRATEHIEEMISQIEEIIANGHAYEADGHVLFNVPSFEEYGGLSGRSRDDQIAGARVDIAPYKKDAADFVLWKPSVTDQPGWDSPWGRGRPGWHIECSAMAEKHLGLPFDIHGGGADLKFPHHENEIAQSCCAHGNHDLSSFAKTWVHNGFVTVEGEKMSKSLGNFTTVHDLIGQGVKGEVMRLALLSGHYRSPLDWSKQGIEISKKSTFRFYSALSNCLASRFENKDESLEEAQKSYFSFLKENKKNEKISKEFLSALCDDLNTSLAITELHKIANEAFHLGSTEKSQSDIANLLLGCGRLLGLFKEYPLVALGHTILETSGLFQKWIEDLLVERMEAKKTKNFKRADEIRDELTSKGIAIEDTPQGPKWRKI